MRHLISYVVNSPVLDSEPWTPWLEVECSNHWAKVWSHMLLTCVISCMSMYLSEGRYDWWICDEYNEWMRPSITFARGGQRGWSLVGIYKDDQLVIFTIDNYYSVSSFNMHWLKVYDGQIGHSFSSKNETFWGRGSCVISCMSIYVSEGRYDSFLLFGLI